MAEFSISQVTAGAGTPGLSRHDLVAGEVITLVATDPVGGGVTYVWEIIDKAGSAAVLSSTSGASVTIGLAGAITDFCAFKIRLTADDGGDITVVERIASVRSPLMGMRYPLFGETAPADATLAVHDADDSTDNATYTDRAGLGVSEQNWRGWAEWGFETAEAIELLGAAGFGSLQTAYNADPEVTTDTDGELSFIRGALAVAAEPLLDLFDGNASPARSAALLEVRDNNVVAGGPSFRVTKGVAGIGVRSRVFGATDLAWSSGLQGGDTTTAVIKGDGGAVFGGSAFFGSEKLRVLGSSRFEGTLTLIGDLSVSGTTTSLDSTTVDIADRVIHLNATTGVVAIPALITGINIERGATAGPTDRDSAALLWTGDSSVVDPSTGTGYWHFAAQTGNDDTTVGASLDVRMRATQYPERSGDPTNIANTGIVYTKDDAGVTELFYEASDGTVTQLTGVSPPVSLQDAYDFGATIATDATGAVAITRDTGTGVAIGAFTVTDNNVVASRTAALVGILDTNVVGAGTPDTFRVSRTASGGRAIRAEVFAAGDIAWSSGLVTPTTTAVVFGDGDAVFGGSAMSSTEKLRVVGDARVEGKLTVTGSIDPTDITLSGGTTAHWMQWAAGTTAPVSAASTMRLRYNESLNTAQVSLNGAAYTDLAVAAGGAVTLQSAYTAGDTITTAASGPVEIVHGASAVDADPAFYVHDDDANTGRTGPLVRIIDSNNSDGLYTSAPLYVRKSSSSATIAAVFEYSLSGATGPEIQLYHSKLTGGGSGVADNVVGIISFWGPNVTGTPTKRQYAAIKGVIEDGTAGSEDGKLDIYCMRLNDATRRALEIKGNVDGVGETGVIFQSRLAAGSATTSISAFTFRVTENYLASDAVWLVEDLGGQLARVEGDGTLYTAGAVAATTGVLVGGTTVIASTTAVTAYASSSFREAAGGVAIQFYNSSSPPTNAATQTSSPRLRLTGQTFDGAAQNRDWDIYTSCLTSQTEAGGFPVAHLVLDYEGVNFLRISTGAPGVGATFANGLIFYQGVTGGGAVPYDFRAINDLGPGDTVFAVRDNSPVEGTSGVLLFTVSGDGRISASGAGTTLLPTIRLTSDADTGIYWPSADHIGFTAAGFRLFDIYGLGPSGAEAGAVFINYAPSASVPFRFQANVNVADTDIHTAWQDSAGTSTANLMLLYGNGKLGLGTTGTAALPTLFYFNDLDTGIYFPVDNEIAFTSGGGRVLTFTGYNVASGEANVIIRSNVAAGANPPFLLRAVADFSAGQAVFILQDNNGSGMSFQVMGDGSVVAVAGAVGAAAYSTNGDQNTGIYFPAADTVAVTTGNAETMRWATGVVTASYTNNGATGPVLELKHVRSNAGVDDDQAGTIDFYTMDDDGTPASARFGRLRVLAADTAKASKDGRFEFWTQTANTEGRTLQIYGAVAAAETGVILEALSFIALSTTSISGSSNAFQWQDTGGVFAYMKGDGGLGLGVDPGSAGILTYKKHTAFAGSEIVKTTVGFLSTTTTPAIAWALTLTDGRAYSVRAKVIGRLTSDGSKRAGYEIETTAYRQGGGATLQGAVTVIHSQESDATWDCTFAVSGNDLRINVNGNTSGAENVAWVLEITYHSVATDS